VGLAIDSEKNEMMNISQNHLEAGWAALKTADWTGAKANFEKTLQADDTPEAQDGLGIALWWLNEISASHHHRTLAYNGFKERGEVGRAALLACWLGREQVFLHSNVTAMRGWFARAERLIGQIAPSRETAWCDMLRASMMDKPDDLERTTFRIIESAQRFNDSDLEAFALAFCGQAQIASGRVGEGMTRLDEAMMMATAGEVGNFMVISEIFCVMLSACETAGDLARSDHWCRIAADFAERHQCPFLSATCRTTYGSLMTAMGRWQDAETALTEAIRAFEIGHRGLRIHAVIRLADLRVCQGKIEEAEVMLAGLEDQGAAVVPLARLCLAKGETTLAKAILEQALQSSSAYTLNQLPALLLLVEVLLAMGDIVSVQQIMAHLAALARQSQSQPLTAQVELAQGQISLHMGDFSAARASFNAALGHLQSYEQSLLAGRVRLKMAQTLHDSDPPGAITWAKAALATFERIGAARDMGEAAHLLRQLGATSGSAPRLRKPLTQREAEILALIALGLSNREIAKRLVISGKTVEHHVSNIFDKLNLRSRAEAAAFAVSGKLTEPPHEQ
jgi:ATP/maltotriose-dependent transcriptional regulator MalT